MMVYRLDKCSGLLEIAKNNADASQELGANKGDGVEVGLRDKCLSTK